MADVTVSYEEMRASAKRLNDARTSIDEQLGSLRAMIGQLVQTSFKTQSASPKFQQSYEQFDKGAKNAVAGLTEMSDFLNKAAQGHQDLDASLAGGLKG